MEAKCVKTMSMVEYLRQQLDLFRTRPAKDRVVDDKHIASLLVSQWLNRVPDDTGASSVVNLRQFVWQEFMKR